MLFPAELKEAFRLAPSLAKQLQMCSCRGKCARKQDVLQSFPTGKYQRRFASWRVQRNHLKPVSETVRSRHATTILFGFFDEVDQSAVRWKSR
jgi:hypothetical protein